MGLGLLWTGGYYGGYGGYGSGYGAGGEGCGGINCEGDGWDGGYANMKDAERESSDQDVQFDKEFSKNVGKNYVSVNPKRLNTMIGETLLDINQ